MATKSSVCVDASLIVRLVIDPNDTVVQRRWEAWRLERQRLFAPTLLFHEVTNALYRYWRAGVIASDSLKYTLSAALAIPIEIVGEPGLHYRALELAALFELPAAYDAHYLALAERLDGEFWTADGKLVRKVQASLPWVKLIG